MTFKTGIAALLLAGIAGSPAYATLLPPATNNVAFSAFDTTTQGTLLASTSNTQQGATFAGTTSLAVYKNTIGTLDFYFQFARTGAGTLASDAIETITGGSFANFMVQALFTGADPDGAGIFATSSNPGAAATAQRNLNGSVVGIDFAPSNPVAGNETSATYIFRTDATTFALGTFGVIDGSTVSGQGFQPTASPVPEASTWAMMMLGFGSLGMAMRGRRARHGVSGLSLPFRNNG